MPFVLPARQVAHNCRRRRGRRDRFGAAIAVELAITCNSVVRDCEGLDQLVGLRALCITECGMWRRVSEG
jgi:hypothetical protein